MRLLLRLLLICLCSLFSSRVCAQSSVTLSKYDINKPPVWIEAPGVQDPWAYTGFGERFTLASDGGFLDSIRIHFDSVAGDLIQIGVLHDVIRETSRGTFHLADYSFFGLIAQYTIEITDLPSTRDFWITIPTEHLPVPKEFHIGVGANAVAQGSDEYTSMFRLAGEPHFGQNATVDSRSNILLTQDFSSFTTDVFDGFFTSNGRPLGIDFHIDAVVELAAASVEQSGAATTAIYPNPVASGGELHVGQSDASLLVLYDVLGNELFRAESWTGSVKLPML